jgi:pilus assembly protein CpaE
MDRKQVACAVVSPDPKFRAWVKRCFDTPESQGLVCAEFPLDPQVVGRSEAKSMSASGAHVVIVDIREDVSGGIEALERLAGFLPGKRALSMGPSLDGDALLRIMQAMPGEFVPEPFADVKLGEALGRMARHLGLAAPADAQNMDDARTLAVFSPKGGAGVTTMAVNLAVALRERTKAPTLLLDMDAGLGTASLLLGLWPKYSVIDVIRSFHRMDGELLRSLVEKHESGLMVLSSPADPNELRDISIDDVRMLLSVLGSHVENIVVDAGSFLTRGTGAGLSSADQVFLLATPEIPTLRNMKRVLPALMRQDPEIRNHLSLVLNRVGPDDMVRKDDVEEVLETEVGWTLPRDDGALTKAANLGAPVVTGGKSSYGSSLMKIVDDLCGAPETPTNSRSGLVGAIGGMFSRKSPKPRVDTRRTATAEVTS